MRDAKMIFVSREVYKLINNPDALSMEVTVYKNGGTDSYGSAVPCVVIEQP